MTGDVAAATPEEVPQRQTVALDLHNVWRAGLLLAGLVAVVLFVRFVLADGGGVIFDVVMGWLASIAMEPAVSRLARHMRRGLATGIVMLGAVAFFVLFFLLFGNLIAEQVASFIRSLPELVQNVSSWASTRLNLDLESSQLFSQANVDPQDLATAALEVAGGLAGVLATAVGGVFSLVTTGLFIFYFSADAPRLKRWVARLLPPRQQEIFLTVYDLAVQKAGGYVAARIVLAGICGSLTAAFLGLIGMPYWLALGVWTGVVSQFIPTIGTYIAIALPVLVGLTSREPVDGILALVFGVAYQQVENLTIEPRISADAVNLHPAVAFGAVLLGAALFGPAGAFVAVPVAALLFALAEIYTRKYDLLPQLDPDPPPTATPQQGEPAQRHRHASRVGGDPPALLDHLEDKG